MSRKLLTAAVLASTISCADPAAITSPDPVSGRASAVNGAACSAGQGQQLIDAGQYQAAIQVFTCVIGLDPTAVDGYRGRIEAELMDGRFSDAVRDYARITAWVQPVHPDAQQVIFDAYQDRLDADPNSVPALAGFSFAYWWDFNYPGAISVLDRLLELQPNSVYGNLFRGSSRLLRGTRRAEGVADLANAVALAPTSPDVRFIIADAYTYGFEPDAQRAFDEAMAALAGGLGTPRIRAILASSYFAFGDTVAAAQQIKLHLDLVTTQLITTPPLAAGGSATLAVVPGRTYEVPIAVAAGESVDIATSSKDFWDTILVVLAADGTPVTGNDDSRLFFAGLKWVAPVAGTYRVRVTSFESINTGVLLLARK